MKSSSSPEGLPSNRITAVRELTQGQLLIDKLREMLPLPEKINADTTSIDNVVVQILEMFDNTLSVLSSCGSKFPRIPINDMGPPSSWDGRKSQAFDKSLTTVIPVKTKRGCYKRRKNSWTSTTVTSILTDDGYAWRKYGQKAILNAKHQRNYYRCTHRFDQRCQATKQVQKIEDEPPKYMITYDGHHTCKNLLRAPQIILDSPNSKDTSNLLSFETKTTIEKKQPDHHFPLAKHGPKESFPPLGLRHEQSSASDHHLSWDPIMQLPQVPLEPVIPMMSSGLDHGDMISRGAYLPIAIPYSCDYEIDDMFGNSGFMGFPSELYS